jgi:hypothetical protein
MIVEAMALCSVAMRLPFWPPMGTHGLRGSRRRFYRYSRLCC